MGQRHWDQVCVSLYGLKDVCEDVIVVRPQNYNLWIKEK